MSVKFETSELKGGLLGIAILNAEKSLNALSIEMIESLYAKLLAWAKDPNVFRCINQR